MITNKNHPDMDLTPNPSPTRVSDIHRDDSGVTITNADQVNQNDMKIENRDIQSKSSESKIDPTPSMATTKILDSILGSQDEKEFSCSHADVIDYSVEDSSEFITAIHENMHHDQQKTINDQQDVKHRKVASYRFDPITQAHSNSGREVETSDPAVPIAGYHKMTVPEIIQRISVLPIDQVQKVKEYEKTHRRRKTLLTKIERILRKPEVRENRSVNNYNDSSDNPNRP
jgi:hypothetical protein